MTDLTGLYDVCISSLFQVVYHPPEGLERATATLQVLQREERRLRQAERQLRPAELSQQQP